MKTKNSFISVIICTASRPKDALECVRSLQNQNYRHFEIIVVDAIKDSPLDSQFRKLRKMGKIAVLKHVKITALNLPLARNEGIKNAKGDIVAFVDDDAIPDKNWLHEINSFFQNNINAIVIGGKILSFYKNYVALFSETFFNLGDTQMEVNQVVGVNMAVYLKRANIKYQFRRNLFDEKLITAGDDTEFSYYLKNKGITIYYDPRMIIYHKFRRSLKEFVNRQFDYAAADLMVMTQKKYQKYSVIESQLKFLKNDQSIILTCYYFFATVLSNTFIFTKEKGIKWFPLSLLRELSYSYGIYQARGQ